MNLQVNLGITIKELRNNLGLSQEKFALSIGMDRTYLASVEAGKRNLSLANIEKIATGLDISVSKLFSKAEKYQ
jgi:transcriptional regulator with XRE-family HTH domain